MPETTSCVIYFVAEKDATTNHTGKATAKPQTFFPTTQESILDKTQQQAVQDHLASHPNHKAVGKFVETPTNIKRAKHWPQLQAAIQACRNHNATLIIAKIGTLANNESFTQTLLDAKVAFYCCDQPFVTQKNLEVLHKVARQQRQHHHKLIREGLKMTLRKKGNVNTFSPYPRFLGM